MTMSAQPDAHPQTVLVFSTLGAGSNDEYRIRELASRRAHVVFPFDRLRKLAMFSALVKKIRRERPDLVVMEGTGLAGGAALLLSRLLFGTKYVVSSGDAVGPWVGTKSRLLEWPFTWYERQLCSRASGFIGWTPYLAGRALTYGCPRAMTAPGWAPFTRTLAEQGEDRIRIRNVLGIGSNQLVVGIAGSLVWNARHKYCYGAELVAAAAKVRRSDVTFLVIGDGNGMTHLKTAAAALPTGRVLFTGRIPQDALPAYYAAMDFGSLPQSVDAVGSFRYTTKLSEYLAFGLPVLTGEIPLAYDLDDGWIARLPGFAPWAAVYTTALAAFVDGLLPERLAAMQAAVPRNDPAFDRTRQIERANAFLGDLLRDRG